MTIETNTSQVFRTEIFNQNSAEIESAYMSDSHPWVVGFSGGKDSTMLMQLLYTTLQKLPLEKRHKHVYVLASDTRVESPDISARIEHELELIKLAADKDQIPITTHLVYPKLNDTFWVNIIGRGYPSPTSHFRWCTDRLKIYPVNEFIQKVVSKSGEVIIVLGARKSESASRAQVMERFAIEGNRYRPHTSLPKAWVYTPIEDLTANEVWTYLIQVSSPWKGNNKALINLYKQANGECPLVIDVSTPSCGQSRFGCWTCTVIDKDKSMQSLVDNGEDHLEPLLEMRNYLKEIRDVPGVRYDRRRNGSIPYRRGTEGTERLTNTGPYKHSVRMEILRRVLAAQKESGIPLIEGDELAIIQEIWNKEENRHPEKLEIPTDIVKRIYKHIYDGEKMPELESRYDFLSKEDEILKGVCDEAGVSFEMMRRLREIEEEYGHLKRRRGLPEEMLEAVKTSLNERDNSN